MKNSKGFTFVELMIGLVFLMIFITFAYNIVAGRPIPGMQDCTTPYYGNE